MRPLITEVTSARALITKTHHLTLPPSVVPSTAWLAGWLAGCVVLVLEELSVIKW